MALFNLPHRLFKGDRLLRTGLGLVVRANVVKFVEFLDNLFPFGQGQEYHLTLVLIDNVLRMNRNHSVSSTVEEG